MSALNPPSTPLTLAHPHPKGKSFDAWRWDLRLILPFHACLSNLPSAGTTRGQRRLESLVDDFRNGTTTRTTVLRTSFPSWFLRMGFRVTARKRSGLSFAGPLCFLKQPLEAFIFGLQFRVNPLHLSDLLFQTLNFLPRPFHALE